MNNQTDGVMRHAFIKGLNKYINGKVVKMNDLPIAKEIAAAIHRKVGLIRTNYVHWNLSDKTASQLVNEGVIIRA